MRLEESVFDTSFPLHYLLKLSSHFSLTIKSKCLALSLHSPASASGNFLQLLYLQVRKPWSLQPRLGDSLQVFHLLGDLFSADLASQSLPICHLYDNGCDPWGRGNVFGEKLLDSVLEAELGWLPLGEREQWELLKSFKMPQKHIFIKSYSLGVKRTKDNIIL